MYEQKNNVKNEIARKGHEILYRPKITFITATFNSVRTLEQTISSILNQTYQNIEYIIIDGGSTDGTLDILKKYGDRIRWMSERDNGICDAVGKGIDFSTGDYINILGSDDSLSDPYIIDAVVKELQDKPDFLSCSRYDVDEKTLLQYPFCNTQRIRNGLTCIPTEGAFIGRHVLEKYPFDRNLRLISDYKLSIQCQMDENIRIKYSDLYTAFFSTSGVSSNQALVEAEAVVVYKKLHVNPRDYYGPVPQGGAYVKKIIHDNLPLSLLMLILLVKQQGLRYIFKVLPLSAYRAYIRFNHPDAVEHICNNKLCRWCHRGI